MSRTRVEALFERLGSVALPRTRCVHLADDASRHPRLLTIWDTGRIACPTCAGRTREQVIAEGSDCPWCCEPATALENYVRSDGPITVVVGLCPDCVQQDTAAQQRRKESAANRKPHGAAFSTSTITRPATAIPNGS